MTRANLVTLMALVLTVQGPGPLAYAKPPAADPAAADAEALYKARRFLEAARAFEALATRHVKYLYYAGLACEAIGHDGQAIAHWRLVAEAPEVEPGLRTRARARAERAETRTTRLLVAVTPATAAPGSTVELSYQGGGERLKRVMKLEALAGGIHLESGTWKIEVRSEGPQYAPGSRLVTLSVRDAEKTVEIELAPVTERVFLTITPREAASSLPRLTLSDDAGKVISESFAATESTLPLQLHPGLWKYRIEAPGFEQAESELLIERGGHHKFSIPLKRRSGLMKTRPLAIGAGVSSALFAAGGTVGLVLSEKKLEVGSEPLNIDVRSTQRALDGLHFGNIAAGASLGFLVTAATAAVKGDRPRRRAWIAEATLGSLLSAGGGIWAGWYFFDIWQPKHLGTISGSEFLNATHLKEYRINFYPSMLMIGTGAALFVGSIAGLALERRPARKQSNHAKARLRMVFPLTVDF